MVSGKLEGGGGEGGVSHFEPARRVSRAYVHRRDVHVAVYLLLNYDVYTSDSKLYAGTSGGVSIWCMHFREISTNIRR